MASLLELGVSTGKWDSGLKKAQGSLDKFIQANGGLSNALDKDSEKMGKFVQMMGRMESTAKTGKGQMGDYRKAIEQLTMQYNRMSDAQKKTIGQDYLRAIDQLKDKYHGVFNEVKNISDSLNGMGSGGGKMSGLSSVLGELGGKGMSKLGGMLSVFGGNMLTKAAGWAMNFASEIGNCVEQGIELAKAGEGIRLAFERLNRPDLLDNLREATHGTVTDIELMKQAVKFNDFKLSLDEMGTLLAFAQQKAKDTGESVDYMVDSIVTGLGRQSLMILDNLGISANEVKEKMKSTGDMTKAVAEIIRDQMSNAGDYIETAADRAAKADVEVKNAMEELGRTFQPLSDAGSALWHNLKVGALDFLNSALLPVINALTEAGRARAAYNRLGGSKEVNDQLSALRGSGFKKLKFDTTVYDYNKQIYELQTIINNGGKKPGAPSGTGRDVRYLKGQLDGLIKIRDEYIEAAKEILNPSLTPIIGGVGGGTTPAKIGRIGGGGRGGARGGGTHQETPEEKAAKLVAAALGNYENAVSTATLRFEMGMDNSEEQQKKLLAAQERLTMAYADAYNITKGENYKTKFEEEAGKYNQMEDVVKGKRDLFNTATAELAGMSVNPMGGLLDQLLGESMEDYAKRKNISLDTGGQGGKMPHGWGWADESAGFLNDTSSALGQIAGGIEDLGIELPEGIEKTLTVMQAIAAILTGISSLVMIITTINATKSIPIIGWALAGGGIPKAAGGMLGGNSFSGDNIPVLVNSGELILNRAQQGNLASQLGGSGIADLHLSTDINAESLRIVLNNNGKRTGRGEYVTTNKRG